MSASTYVPQVTFRNCDRSESIEQAIREHADWLERFFPRILSCRVLVEKPHRHHQKGALYHLRIEIGTPGKCILISRNGIADHAHEDLRVAVRDAFLAARRRLEDQARVHRNRNRAPQAEAVA
jgi:hypothetical protein